MEVQNLRVELKEEIVDVGRNQARATAALKEELLQTQQVENLKLKQEITTTVGS